MQYPDDPAMRARVKAYELAAKMQLAVPEVMDIVEGDGRDAEALRPRQPDHRGLRPARAWSRGGWPSAACGSCRCTTAAGGGGGWDAHGKLKDNHAKNSARVDKPIAGLLDGPEANAGC